MPYTDFHYTPTGTGVISGKEVLEQTEDAINDLGGQISGDVQTAIDTANNALNTATTASADAQNAVNTANTAYTAATNAQNTANTAQNTASNALTAAQNAQNDVNALGNRVTTAENNITQNTTDISGLTTRMGIAEGNITTLQNDVITAQGTATSAQNTATLARGQAYVVRYASVAVSANSTVPYTDLNNVDNIKANDLLLDTNGKLYQISSVDTANETVSVTTPLTQLAVDSDVVHKSGDETVGGQKTLVNLLPLKGEYLGTEASNNARTLLYFIANRDTQNQSGIYLTKFRQNKAQGSMSGNDVAYLSFDCLENSVRTNNGLRINFLNFVNDIPQRFILWSAITERLLGTDSAPWSGVYATNYYYGNDNVEFSTKFVTTDTNQNVAGIKNFTDDTYFKSLNFTNEVASTSSSGDATLPILSTVTYTDQTPSATARVNLSITAGGFKSLYPHENNVYSLGLNNRLWSDFYSYHGYFRGQQQNDEYSSNARTNLTLMAYRDTLGQSGCVVDTFRENTTQGTGGHILGFGIKENSVRYEGCRFSWLYDNDNNGYVFALRPTTQGTNQPIKYELGNSSSKWSTINGINPGALSLPDTSNAIDISGYITDLTGSVNTYTAPADGYVSIRITGTAMRMTVTNGVESSCQRSASGAVACYVPVVAGGTVSVYAVGTSVNNAIFRPCQGNV